MKPTKVKDMSIIQIINLMQSNLYNSGKTGITFINVLARTCTVNGTYIEMAYTCDEKNKKNNGTTHLYRMNFEEEFILSENVKIAKEIFNGL